MWRSDENVQASDNEFMYCKYDISTVNLLRLSAIKTTVFKGTIKILYLSQS